MGRFVNPDNSAFQAALNSRIYVDKTGLIEKTNAVLDTRQKFLCVSRPRRFGKSMAADMLAAYYERGEDADLLFRSLKISKAESYRAHLNQYDVIKVNIQEFLSMTGSMDEMLSMLKKYLVFDLMEHFDDIRFRDESNLIQVMKDIYAESKCPFVLIIDEWDCIFREFKNDKEAQEKYLDFLRAWLKDKEYVALAYMTGILPIKKYGSHSALNMFTEYSMTDPGELAEYFGFTGQEVAQLCQKYEMDFGEAQESGKQENRVRIMSIHKSKGLEFPIVFVAGTGKQFNTQDLKGSIVIHPRNGVGIDVVDLEMRTKAPTFLKKMIQDLCDILGLITEKKAELLDADIENLIQERQDARKAKNFARADEIRNMLSDKGIILEDTREGVKWKRA